MVLQASPAVSSISNRRRRAPSGLVSVGVGSCAALFLATAWAAVSVAAASASQPAFTGPYPNAFATHDRALVVLQTVAKRRITCTSEEGGGAVTSSTTLRVTLGFKGCTLASSPGTPGCEDFGGQIDEIPSQELVGTLGYINTEPKEVGLRLTGASGTGLAAFFCGEDTWVEWTGAVIGRIKRINRPIKAGVPLGLRYGEVAGHQRLTSFVDGVEEVSAISFDEFPSMQAGLRLWDTVTFSGPIEISAP